LKNIYFNKSAGIVPLMSFKQCSFCEQIFFIDNQDLQCPYCKSVNNGLVLAPKDWSYHMSNEIKKSENLEAKSKEILKILSEKGVSGGICLKYRGSEDTKIFLYRTFDTKSGISINDWIPEVSEALRTSNFFPYEVSVRGKLVEIHIKERIYGNFFSVDEMLYKKIIIN
jgi:hypothetical protein